MRTLIKKNDVVHILPQWQDEGDDKLTFIAVEDETPNCENITIEAQLGLPINPQQRVSLSMLKQTTPDEPQLALRIGNSRQVVAVASIKEASEAWEKLRDENNLGASESPRVTVINLKTGKMVARISYNGRAWAKDGTEIAL